MTPGQQRLLDAVRTFKIEHGYAPTVRELGQTVGLAISTVHHHLKALEHQGLVSRAANHPRTLVVIDPPEDNDDQLEDPSPPDPGTTPDPD